MEPKHYPILDRVNLPSDLKALSEPELIELCADIRRFLCDNVLKTGGHLASNLGVVELTVALHRVFDAPTDSLIWDVGHQTYVHKILTGRKDRFPTLRTPGGLSGFTRRDESPYDPFGAGHSSTSISAAIGIARAKKLSGDPSYTIAILGDGAFTGGLIHEALNNIDRDLRLILILNENEMSISRNIGGFAGHLQKLRKSRHYYRTKRATRNFLQRIPLIGQPIFRTIRRVKQTAKNILYNSSYFEDLGIYYLGPLDGHDLPSLERILGEAKDSAQSTVLHIKTVKGKGFGPAEDQPDLYHGVCPGNRPPEYNYSSEMGRLLCEMAENDPKILAITAAMAEGCGLSDFAERYPNRFFDVGIAEEHALVFAAGLAAGGYKPVFAVYSTFLQRGYDQLIHDIALQKLAVTICIDRASLSSGDGPTHHGIFDVAFLGQIPGIDLYAPYDYRSLADCLKCALDSGRPSCIRYPNASESSNLRRLPCEGGGGRSCFDSSTPAELRDKISVLLVSYGRIADEVLTAATRLASEGIVCGMILLEKLLPLELPAELITDRLAGLREDVPIVFIEEGIRRGGEGMLLFDFLRENPLMVGRRQKILAIDDPFRLPRAEESILDCHGLSAEKIADAVRRLTAG